MRGFWSRFRPGRPSTGRPKTGVALGVLALEVRRMPVVFFPGTNGGPTPPTFRPHALVPPDGRTVPVDVSGTFTQVYQTNFAGAYKPYPIPVQTATALNKLVHPDPNDPSQNTGKTTVNLPGVPVPVEVSYFVSAGVPGKEIVRITTIPGSAGTVAEARLRARPAANHARLQVIDQYRRLEPAVVAPTTLTDDVHLDQNYNNFTFGNQLVQVPSGLILTRNYAYKFTVNLTASERAAAGGRQYAATVFIEDADNGNSTTGTVIVPNIAAPKRK